MSIVVKVLVGFVALFVVGRRRASVPPQRQQVSGYGMRIQADGDVTIGDIRRSGERKHRV